MTERTAHAPPVTDAQARRTALVVAAVLLAVAAWSLYRGRAAAAAVAGGLGALLVLAALAWPAAAHRFHVLWMRLATALGWVNSRVLLGLMFYGVFVPYGVVSRLAGRDPLRRRGRTANRDTYWVARRTTRQSKEQFERLF